MPESSPFIAIREDVYHLSGSALLELSCAVLERGKPFRFRAHGTSMSPFICDGDIVTITPVHNAAPIVGAVVAFRHTVCPRLLVHRIVARHGECWLLRGDNALQADGVIVPADILGRVARVERQGRPVRLGLGMEGRLIAWLSRLGWLPYLFRAALICTRPFRRKRSSEEHS